MLIAERDAEYITERLDPVGLTVDHDKTEDGTHEYLSVFRGDRPIAGVEKTAKGWHVFNSQTWDSILIGGTRLKAAAAVLWVDRGVAIPLPKGIVP